jgi:hypothetical protein
MHDRDRFDALARHGFRFAALGSVVFIGLAVGLMLRAHVKTRFTRRAALQY